jgi:hypothetical protein
LANLVIARVQHHVPRVRVDTDESLDLALDPGLLARLAHARLGDRLADVHRPAGHRPVLVVGPTDQQHLAALVDHAYVDRRHQAVCLWSLGVV